jgi:chromosome segregation ATPase
MVRRPGRVKQTGNVTACYLSDMSDLAVEILKQIRDERRGTNGRLDGVQTRLDETNSRLERVEGRVERVETRLEQLERRQTETEIRLATELVAVVGAVRELREALLEDRKLRETIANHETRLAALERKTGS